MADTYLVTSLDTLYVDCPYCLRMRSEFHPIQPVVGTVCANCESEVVEVKEKTP